ncbi:carbon-nitrogen hydrolase family protein [Streptomyces griseiscabiei]|uniref:Carbon-nitrogen hydrolase family protein n=1 Tax=Streptomyces griseiscabiei TaxID=2993540 RepID=A0ABU4L5H2_9ACTN|nr:carbon-nitrogen hydrolase family protein [Streptomyces griseiscabiei]MBZ3905272.1 carbon-nitrogen hydrolase family protein [Streptomyces griseiscabiei]MDX2910358.1 carbon-nitrogen hydrolase family protein [Streptomyces griseiscabiei]
MTESVRTFRAAAVQAEPAWTDVEAGVAKTVDLIAEAARGGARLIAFPEVWIPGYPHFLWLGAVADQIPHIARYHANSLAPDSPGMTTIRHAARRHDITVVLGHSEKDHGTLYISQTVIASDGSVLLHRRKLKPTHVERSLFGEGDGSDLKVVDSPLGRIGALSCAEHVQPLSKYALYAQHEQVHVASWPCFGLYRDLAFQLSAEANIAATQVYAIEGGAFVLMATQVISPAGIDLFATTPEQRRLLTAGGGCSRVFGPDGRTISKELAEDEEGLVYADIDLDLIDIAKNAYDPAGHYSRADAAYLVHRRARRTPVVADGADGPAETDFPPLEGETTEGGAA